MLRTVPLLTIAAVIGCQAADASAANRWAILCEGTAHYESSFSTTPREPLEHVQTFVIDEGRQVVERALHPRQQFDDLCGAGESCFVSISPGLIQLVSERDGPYEGFSSETRFTADRKTGAANYVLHLRWANGNYEKQTWRMTCRPTAVPVFDTSQNKF